MTLDQRAWFDAAVHWMRLRTLASALPEQGVFAMTSPPSLGAGGGGASASAAPEATGHVLELGSKLAGLNLQRRLTRGASGAGLYLARDPGTGTAFAVKTFALTDLPKDRHDEVRQQFLHEGRVAASLRHPDIVRVDRVGEERDHVYLVMEYLSGTNLARYTKPGRLLPEPLVLTIAARVAGALSYAHAHGVFHRDVKPANVMFQPPDRITITDFGIASLAHAEHRRASSVFGSPATMAPEQLMDARVDGRADLYALGVMLFQLLTGRLPYRGHSVDALVNAIVKEPALALSTYRPELPAELTRLVARLLDKRPDRRPANGDGVARVLRGLAKKLQPQT